MAFCIKFSIGSFRNDMYVSQSVACRRGVVTKDVRLCYTSIIFVWRIASDNSLSTPICSATNTHLFDFSP